MEKANNIFVVTYTGAWTDLGGWDAVWRRAPKDDRGVSEWGSTTAIDCDNKLLRGDSRSGWSVAEKHDFLCPQWMPY